MKILLKKKSNIGNFFKYVQSVQYFLEDIAIRNHAKTYHHDWQHQSVESTPLDHYSLAIVESTPLDHYSLASVQSTPLDHYSLASVQSTPLDHYSLAGLLTSSWMLGGSAARNSGLTCSDPVDWAVWACSRALCRILCNLICSAITSCLMFSGKASKNDGSTPSGNSACNQ